MTQSTGPGTRPRSFLGEVHDAVTPGPPCSCSA